MKLNIIFTLEKLHCDERFAKEALETLLPINERNQIMRNKIIMLESKRKKFCLFFKGNTFNNYFLK